MILNFFNGMLYAFLYHTRPYVKVNSFICMRMTFKVIQGQKFHLRRSIWFYGSFLLYFFFLFFFMTPIINPWNICLLLYRIAMYIFLLNDWLVCYLILKFSYNSRSNSGHTLTINKKRKTKQLYLM